ncbi:response regulator [bacterium]|nr:response regulator [bacterium]
MPKEDPIKSINVLIVDDEPDIHKMFLIILRNFRYCDKKINFLSAFSKNEAIKIIQQNSIAVIFLDVIMEENNSGLVLVDTIRNKIKNRDVRIILVTGHPGAVPQLEVVVNYEIDGYLEKGDFDAQKLFVALTIALRGYERIAEIKDNYERLRLLRQFSRQHTRFEGIKHLTNVVYNYLTKVNCIDKVAIFENQKLFLCNGNEQEFNDVFKEWMKRGKDKEVLDNYAFLKIRELENYQLIIKSAASHQEANRLYSLNLVDQALAVREGIINVVKNDKLLLDLYFISTNQSSILYLEATGRGTVLHFLDREPEKLGQHFKTINLFFDNNTLLQISRSILINVSQIKTVKKTSSRSVMITLSNDQMFSVARSHIEKAQRLI